MHDRGVVPIEDSPDARITVHILRISDVGKDAACQHKFTGLDVADDLVGVDPNDLCRVAEDCASD